MANSTETLELQRNRKPEIALARTLAALVSLGCLTSPFLLAKVAPILGGLLKGLEVDLPFAARFLVANYGWISALFVAGVVVLPTVTEFLIRATRRRTDYYRLCFRSDCCFSCASCLYPVLALDRVSQEGGPGKIIPTAPCH
jgi:type II secretory pathway component PulF